MLSCSIRNCRESHSEILGDPRVTKLWFVGDSKVWPQLIGTQCEKIILCPRHRKEVFNEVLEIRKMQEN